jgi:hypothetical protein
MNRALRNALFFHTGVRMVLPDHPWNGDKSMYGFPEPAEERTQEERKPAGPAGRVFYEK